MHGFHLLELRLSSVAEQVRRSESPLDAVSGHDQSPRPSLGPDSTISLVSECSP